jgi:cytochrome c-type biogenesis protein CcmH
VRLLALAVLASLVLAPAAFGSERQPTQSELEGELVCPTCHTTLDQSNAPIALRMKQVIAQRIAAGDTKSEIKAALVAQFGRGVLAAPERKGFDLLAWILPVAGLLAGAAVLTFLLWRWTRRPEEELPLLE